jgi:hypothetical protein
MEDIAIFRSSTLLSKKLMYSPITHMLVHFVSVMSNVFYARATLATNALSPFVEGLFCHPLADEGI